MVMTMMTTETKTNYAKKYDNWGNIRESTSEMMSLGELVRRPDAEWAEKRGIRFDSFDWNDRFSTGLENCLGARGR